MIGESPTGEKLRSSISKKSCLCHHGGAWMEDLRGVEVHQSYFYIFVGFLLNKDVVRVYIPTKLNLLFLTCDRL
jgi:hypothetical protein